MNIHTIIIEFDDIVSNIDITIDNKSVTWQAHNRLITIDNIVSGFHQLKITNLVEQRINVKKVVIDQCDLEKLLYLSWGTTVHGQIFQPNTELWELGMTWTLPFGCPVSNWIDVVGKQIRNNLYGQNLYQHYHLYYPDSIDIDCTSIPTLVKDFYRYNFNFTAIDKNNIDLTKVPYIKYEKKIPENLLQNIIVDIHKNITIDEVSALSNWKVWWLLKHNVNDMTVTVSDLDSYPSIQELINYLNLDALHCFLGYLPPGTSIRPHIDDLNTHLQEHYPNYQGCTQLYIPLEWPLGSSIKFAGVGLVPINKNCPYVINTDYLTHAAVNTSDQGRWVLAIRCHQNIIKDCVFDK